MKFSDLDNSKYLSKKDVPDTGLDLTIAGFELVQLKDGQKPAMSFREPGVKPMLVNKTNRNRLSQLFKTDESRNMVGRQINVWHDPNVEMGGELVGGLRVRPCVGHGAPVAPQAAPDANTLATAMALLEKRAKDAWARNAAEVLGTPAEPPAFHDDIPF